MWCMEDFLTLATPELGCSSAVLSTSGRRLRDAGFRRCVGDRVTVFHGSKPFRVVDYAMIDCSCCAPPQQLPGFQSVQGLIQPVSDRRLTTGSAKFGDKLHLGCGRAATLGFQLESKYSAVAKQDQVRNSGANT